VVQLLHGGSIDIHKGGYYLTMGTQTDHPSVSGLNAYGGINMHGNGISNITALAVLDANEGYHTGVGQATFYLRNASGGQTILTFYRGILTEYEVQ